MRVGAGLAWALAAWGSAQKAPAKASSQLGVKESFIIG
jgi:hypothetical protein